METNLLIALKNIIQSPDNSLKNRNKSLNRMNSMGEALEFFVKDAFCGAFGMDDLLKIEKLYHEKFSYLGNQNNPPDIIIRNGDAVEVKKHIGSRPGGLALNSSYPKDFLYADSPMITVACRECEDWEKKDILYSIGSIVGEKINSLWFVYGDCYAADRKVYERIRNAISTGVNSLPDIEFGETNELGRVNKVDPLGITDLRIRGMWGIKHPAKVFDYIPEATATARFNVFAVMLQEKYNLFLEKDRGSLEKLQGENFLIKDIEIKSPNNPAKYLKAKLMRFSK